MEKPRIYSKYWGKLVKRVYKDHIEQKFATEIAQTGMEVKIAFHGTSLDIWKVYNQLILSNDL